MEVKETPSEYRKRNRLPMLMAGLVGTLLLVAAPVFAILYLSGLQLSAAAFVAVLVWMLVLACAAQTQSGHGAGGGA